MHDMPNVAIITANGTFYPTGGYTGLTLVSGAAVVSPPGDTVSTTSGESMFVDAAGQPIYNAVTVIRRVIKMSTVGTLQFEGHAGTAILPLITATALRSDSWDVPIMGPWRMVAAASFLGIVVFDVDLQRAR